MEMTQAYFFYFSLFTQVQIQLSTVMTYLVRSHFQRLDTKLAAFGKQLLPP